MLGQDWIVSTSNSSFKTSSSFDDSSKSSIPALKNKPECYFSETSSNLISSSSTSSLTLKVTNIGTLSADCIGVPESISISTTMQCGLVGRYTLCGISF